MEEIWSEKDVKREYSKAFSVLADCVARDGPKQFGTAWPDTYCPVDSWINYHSKTNKDDSSKRVRLPRTSREISQMNQIMIEYRHPATGQIYKSWFAEFLQNRDKLKTCLVIHAISDLTKIPEKSLSKRKGIAYSTYRQRRDDAARIIAGNLNRLAVPMF